MMLQNAFEQNSVYVQGRYDLFDNVTFRSEVLYNQRESTVQVAGYPISSGNLGIVLSADSYYNPLGRWTDAGQNFRYVRPDGSVLSGPQDLRFFRRGVERPRVTRNTAQVFHFGGGFEGTFDVGKNLWNWDVNYNFNRNDGNVRGSGNIDLIKAQQALGPSFLDTDGVVRCGSPGNAIDGCVPWNVLAGVGGYTEEMMDGYYLYTHDRFGTRTTNYTANLTGDIVELPAGPLAFAAGYEYRNESGYVEPDYYSTTGNSSQLVAGGTSGGYTTKEYYAELSVPILRDVAFVKNLSLNVAERHSSYSNFGGTNNGKLSVLWNVNDDLLLRANYAEGFRAPAIGELFAGVGQSFDTFLDPCDTVFGAAAANPAAASATTSARRSQVRPARRASGRSCRARTRTSDPKRRRRARPASSTARRGSKASTCRSTGTRCASRTSSRAFRRTRSSTTATSPTAPSSARTSSATRTARSRTSTGRRRTSAGSKPKATT
jgi:iron complex outermembrane receptor protein